jgi:hypothetical protein
MSMVRQVISAVSILILLTAMALAQNLFEADEGSGNIYEFTPSGAKITFASGLNGPCGLAFNSAGNLFEADNGSNSIYEFTPGGAGIFASGLDVPVGLAFQPIPEPTTLLLFGLGAFILRHAGRKVSCRG